MSPSGLLTLDSVIVHGSLTARYKEDFFKKKNHLVIHHFERGIEVTLFPPLSTFCLKSDLLCTLG